MFSRALKAAEGRVRQYDSRLLKVLRCGGCGAGYVVMVDGLEKLDWRKVALIGVAINGAFVAFVAKAAAAIEREERERNRVRWTDKNRWE